METGVFLEWNNLDLDVGSNMFIYDGDNNAADILAFSGRALSKDEPPVLFGNESGCLTIQFISSAPLDAKGILGPSLGAVSHASLLSPWSINPIQVHCTCVQVTKCPLTGLGLFPGMLHF